MSSIQNFSWAETELDKLVPQLVNIGDLLKSPLGATLGVTSAQASDWQRGAAVLAWMQRAIPITRDYSTAMTNARDRLLIDKKRVRFVLPALLLPAQSPEVAAALADADFVTDYLDACDELVENTIKKSPNFNTTVEKQLGLLPPTPPPDPATLKPTIRSAHDGAGGLVEFNCDRQNQPQILVTVTLDDGRVFTNRLPSAKIPVELPGDRPYGFTAVAQYCDKMGKVYGLVSEPFRGTSAV